MYFFGRKERECRGVKKRGRGDERRYIVKQTEYGVVGRDVYAVFTVNHRQKQELELSYPCHICMMGPNPIPFL